MWNWRQRKIKFLFFLKDNCMEEVEVVKNDEPIEMDLTLEKVQTGGGIPPNITDILNFMNTKEFNVLKNAEKNITLKISKDNRKTEEKSNYFASGSESCVFLVDDDENQLVLKVIKIDKRNYENHKNNFVKKYEFDTDLIKQYKTNTNQMQKKFVEIPKIMYYGKILKPNYLDDLYTYFYVLVPKYNTNFDDLDVFKKLIFLKKLMDFLGFLHSYDCYLMDLKLINLGYYDVDNDIVCVIIDYGNKTLQPYTINGHLNIHTSFRGNSYFPNYAIEFVNNLDGWIVKSNIYLLGQKYDKFEVFGLATVIFDLFFEDFVNVHKRTNGLDFLRVNGTYYNKYGMDIHFNFSPKTTKDGMFYENAILKDFGKVSDFIGLATSKYDADHKMILELKFLMRRLLHPNYENIISYTTCSNIVENLINERVSNAGVGSEKKRRMDGGKRYVLKQI